jgi:hypothetical protein
MQGLMPNRDQAIYKMRIINSTNIRAIKLEAFMQANVYCITVELSIFINLFDEYFEFIPSTENPWPS